MAERYAVYYAPDRDSALGRFGNSWLGRCPESGEQLERPRLPGVDDGDIHALTSDPRHYGFHGTLVPPFRLGEDVTPDEFMAAVVSHAAGLRPFDLDPLSVREIGSFVALVPAGQEKVGGLAGNCVRAFHRFREEPKLAELERRRARGLTPAQEWYLVRWGYPYVFEEFRFHLTLTNSISNSGLRRKIVKELSNLTALCLKTTHQVRELCLFYQTDGAAPFSLIDRISFGE